MNWNERPSEIAYLLNPAFYCLVLRAAVDGYEKTSNKAAPYELIYLIPGFTLHKTTREQLPNRSNLDLLKWVNKNDDVKIGFSNRVNQLLPYTREALLFGIQHGVLAISENRAGIIMTDKEIKYPASWVSKSTPKMCLSKGKALGKCFAKIGDINTIYRFFGLRI